MLETTLIRRFNYGLQGNQMYVHERLQIFKKYTSVMICSIYFKSPQPQTNRRGTMRHCHGDISAPL